MGYSSQNKLLDPIRKIKVSATPEELVRQRCIKEMVELKQFPPNLIGVEKSLGGLSHLKSLKRRFDILTYYRHQSEIKPLLIVECKAHDTHDALMQVLGYAQHLEVPFIGVAFPTRYLVVARHQAFNVDAYWHTIPNYNDLKKPLIYAV